MQVASGPGARPGRQASSRRGRSQSTQRLAPCWPEVQAHRGHECTLQLPDGAAGDVRSSQELGGRTSGEGRPARAFSVGEVQPGPLAPGREFSLPASAPQLLSPRGPWAPLVIPLVTPAQMEAGGNRQRTAQVIDTVREAQTLSRERPLGLEQGRESGTLVGGDTPPAERSKALTPEDW